MDPTRREALRDLLRRVDEVRGMSERGVTHTALEPGDTDALIHTLNELVEELERSHRRLVETNVQLASLREVASSMVTALDTGETTRTVTRYLSRAFGFEDVFLLLIDRERGVLEGTWSRGVPGHDREQSYGLELPMLDGGDNLGPSWSPDGNWIAFTSFRDGNNEIYLIHPDGTGLTRVTNNPMSDWQPRWGR